MGRVGNSRKIKQNTTKVVSARLSTTKRYCSWILETTPVLDKPVLLVTHSMRVPRDFISTTLRARGYATHWVRPFLGQPLPAPDPDAYAGAVFYGGPQLLSEIDKDPYLHDELAWIRAFVDAGGRYLGLCLGGQLLSMAYGGDVYQREDGVREVGYYDLHPTQAGIASGYFSKSPMLVYHWHREGIRLPSGVDTLASSDYFPNQAFSISETALGTQFHPEITDAMIRLWSAHAPADRDKEPGTQPRETHLDGYVKHQATVQQWAGSMLDRLGFEAQPQA